MPCLKSDPSTSGQYPWLAVFREGFLEERGFELSPDCGWRRRSLRPGNVRRQGRRRYAHEGKGSLENAILSRNVGKVYPIA